MALAIGHAFLHLGEFGHVAQHHHGADGSSCIASHGVCRDQHIDGCIRLHGAVADCLFVANGLAFQRARYRQFARQGRAGFSLYA